MEQEAMLDSETGEQSDRDQAVNREFNELTTEVLGDSATGDQTIPLRERLGAEPRSGALVVPDPGDLEPLHYPPLSDDDILMLPTWAQRAHTARRQFDRQNNARAAHAD